MNSQVVDVYPKLTAKQKKLRAIGFSIVFLIFCTFLVYSYKHIYLPKVWRSQVNNVISQLKELDDSFIERYSKYQEEIIKIEELGERLTHGPRDIPLSTRIKALSSAFELAEHLGSPAANYLYGSAILAGRVGVPDKVKAEEQFRQGLKKITEKVASGDARANLYYALMLNAGLAMPADPSRSYEMINQIQDELPKSDLIRLHGMILDGSFTLVHDKFLLERFITRRLINLGERFDYFQLFLVCDKFSHSADAAAIQKCIQSFETSQRANGVKPQQELGPASSKPSTDFQKVIPRVDPEAQDSTGYVKGTQQASMGGKSTFTIDNTRGSSDAIGRLYLNGAKPAVRSMYVKAGESFKALSLAAGAYVFRYRHIGSDSTFEADRQVILSETFTETGVRYSTVTITIYKEAGGNLTVKKVSPDDF